MEGGVIELPPIISVKDLADATGVSGVEVIKHLMANGVMATINQTLDYDTAAVVAADMGYEPREAEVVRETAEQVSPQTNLEAFLEEPDETVLRPRYPVVTVLGHVDHGKTSLLDAIRRTNVTSGEAGGITQHIGAYQVKAGDQRITFLDTPGHEAFTAMRARGAQVTDIAILVVASDDGVMPQTIEAIDHAKAAGVPIIAAITKVDLESANVDRVKQQLSEHGLVSEDWGGETITVPISVRTGEGLQSLLENILVVAEVRELKANPDRPAVGTVIEAELDANRGPLATILVRTGTLNAGAVVVVGETWGRVKAMFNDQGRRIEEAGPSAPVTILGLQNVPAAGDLVLEARDERAARGVIERKARERDEERMREQRSVTLETLFGEISAGKVKDLNIIVKTDVQGSIDPIRSSLERLTNEEVRVKIIHSATGTITESDVMLAVASKGIIIGFNTTLEPGARRQAEIEGVDIRMYNIIYNLVEDVEKALKGMLAPTFREVVEAHAEVRQVFKVRRGVIAGCIIRDGNVTRGVQMRVLRGTEVIHTGRVDSLRRFTEDVREVQSGYECGIGSEGFGDYVEGDIIETFRVEQE